MVAQICSDGRVPSPIGKSGHPILLRVWKNTGHGSADRDTSVLQAAEWVGFVMRELGMRVA